MLLTLDIGNTSINFAVVRGKTVAEICQVATSVESSELSSKTTRTLKYLNKKYPAIKDVVVCSVVPRALKGVEEPVKTVFGSKAFVIGRDIVVPVKNRYKNPEQVGRDRLVCAYAAMKLYGVPAIIIDLGTAITLDVVSKKKEYEGGIIVPGIRLSAESLYKKTALLPRIDIHKPPALIGRDTESSILSGIFNGYGVMLQGLIKELTKEIGTKPKVIVTGGYASLMKNFIHRKIDVVDKNLVFNGMYLLYQDFVNKK